jgi:signal transduction histidine kinase
LQNLREHFQLIGGRLEVVSRPGQGTRLVSSLPGELLDR